MKITSKLSLMILAVLLIALFTLPAKAQFDIFGENRAIVLAKPANMLYSATWPVTNAPIDTIGTEGIAVVSISSATNGAGGTLTATVQHSNDKVTWTPLSNYALASYTTQIITNRYYGTNGLTATNVVMLNGTLVTPTAAGGGFATTYLQPALFTNTASTVSIATNAYTIIAYNSADVGRYVQLVLTPGGTLTNNWTSALWTGRRQQY